MTNEVIKTNNTNVEPAKWERTSSVKNADFEASFTSEKKQVEFKNQIPVKKMTWAEHVNGKTQQASWLEFQKASAPKQTKGILVPWNSAKNQYEVRPAWYRNHFRIDL